MMAKKSTGKTEVANENADAPAKDTKPKAKAIPAPKKPEIATPTSGMPKPAEGYKPEGTASIVQEYINKILNIRKETQELSKQIRELKNALKAQHSIPKMAVNMLVKMLETDYQTFVDREQEFFALYQMYAGKSLQHELFSFNPLTGEETPVNVDSQADEAIAAVTGQ